MEILGINVKEENGIWSFDLLGDIYSSIDFGDKKLMIKKCERTIRKVITQRLYEDNKDKLNGKYLVISPIFRKDYPNENIIMTQYLSSTYQGKNLKFWTDNELAVKLKEFIN